MADKAKRVGELAVWFAERIECAADPTVFRRAAALAKADLMTHMVGEFPELQGVMGGHYLRLEGEPEELWQAARDHYRPQGFEGPLPSSRLGRLIGASDRLDTVAGLYAVDEIPSGSKDPHGLRRAAQGLVRIVAESEWDLDLGEAIGRAVELLSDGIDVDQEAARESVQGFVAGRVRRYLIELVDVAFDTADAVMAAGWSMLPVLVARARALEEARSAPAFRSLSLAFKRVRNITDGQPDGEIDSGLFEHAEEEELHRASSAFHDRLGECREKGELEQAFSGMADMAEVLDRFFDEVLVMADDDRVRANRIALLRSLRGDFMRLADLSKLQIEGGDE
jgi:glycyl-tRNA synthetase beta chain